MPPMGPVPMTIMRMMNEPPASSPSDAPKICEAGNGVKLIGRPPLLFAAVLAIKLIKGSSDSVRYFLQMGPLLSSSVPDQDRKFLPCTKVKTYCLAAWLAPTAPIANVNPVKNVRPLDNFQTSGSATAAVG
jgi:hypothetical protein